MAGIKAGFGVDAATEGLTHREIQARRAQVREKFEGRGRQGGKRRAPKQPTYARGAFGPLRRAGYLGRKCTKTRPKLCESFSTRW